MTKLRDLKALGLEELRVRATELDDEVVRLRLRRATGQLANPMAGREARRALARVKTLIRQHETEGADG